MTDRVQIESVPGIPTIVGGDNIASIIFAAAKKSGQVFHDNDILCVASKAVSIAEGRVISLTDVEVSEVAEEIHRKVPRKDPRTIQVIINETGASDGSRLELGDNYIGGWLPNGLMLTSAGVDKNGPEEVILIPKNPDISAQNIGRTILESSGVNVAVIITDSDGRMDKKGATQIAIGIYGVPPLRIIENTSEETLCDMLAASAALVMGQRDTNKPAVIIRGIDYKFDTQANINKALNNLPNKIG